jgi:hypothetical protein
MNVTITHTDITNVSDHDILFAVVAYDAQGREYTLLEPMFERATDARRLEAVVAAAGVIDADQWACRAPYGTEAWLIDGCEQRQIEDEREGWA